MDYNEATAAMAVDDGLGTATETNTYEGGTSDSGATNDDFIRTPAAPAEVPKQLKHRGSITGIVALTANSGSRGIEVTVHSDSNGRDYKQTIWPPRQWTDNVFITEDEMKAFPAPEGTTAKGNAKQTPYQRFGKTIKSTDGRGELQRIITAGTKASRALNASYADFTTLVENLDTGLAGTPVIFVTGPDGDPDPQYGFKITVRSLMPFDANYEKLRQDDAGGN